MSIGKKLNALIIIPHTGSGIASPFVAAMGVHFNISNVCYINHLLIWKLYFRMITFSMDRKKWYDKYMHRCEKTPQAFKILTKRCELIIKNDVPKVDVIIMGGAMLSIGKYVGSKPYFIFTDSTRNLSALNTKDIRSQFINKADEKEWYKLEEFHYKNASGVMARSGVVKKSLVNFYDIKPSNVLVRNFGVGLSHSKGDFEKKYDGQTILFVAKGDFVAKGGDVVLTAFNFVLTQLPNSHLILVGQDTIKSTKNITSLGLVRDRDMLRELYEKSNVFVLPSFIDRFGMSLLEAMAALTPCIGTNRGAIPEIISDTGYLIEPGDAEELAAKIILLLQDHELSRELGIKARRRFEKEMSWEAVGRDISTFVYKKMDAKSVPS